MSDNLIIITVLIVFGGLLIWNSINLGKCIVELVLYGWDRTFFYLSIASGILCLICGGLIFFVYWSMKLIN